MQILFSLNAVAIAIKVRRLHWIWNCSNSHHSWWKRPFPLKRIKVESSLLQAALSKAKLFVDCRDEDQLVSLDLILPLFLFPTPQFFIASGSGFFFILQPRACVCIRQVPRHLCLRYQICKVERSQTTKLDAKVFSTKLDASENCFNLQFS